MKKSLIAIILVAVFGLASSASAGHRIFVGGLSWGTTSGDVAGLVAPFGPVESIVVQCTDQDGEQSATAEIEFVRRGSAIAAVRGLDGLLLGDRPISAKRREIVVVGSKVKKIVRGAGLRSDGELVAAVSEKVHEILQAAIKRAKANKRGTVRPHDL